MGGDLVVQWWRHGEQGKAAKEERVTVRRIEKKRDYGEGGVGNVKIKEKPLQFFFWWPAATKRRGYIRVFLFQTFNY